VKLKRVSVAGATVADVDALVIEDGLDTSLLGMTYLGRLSRFEATRTALILRP
jgi:aspartyl protease family protein